MCLMCQPCECRTLRGKARPTPRLYRKAPGPTRSPRELMHSTKTRFASDASSASDSLAARHKIAECFSRLVEHVKHYQAFCCRSASQFERGCDCVEICPCRLPL